MKTKGLSIVTGIVSLGCVLLASGNGQALTTAEIQQELDNCYDGCLRTFVACNPPCCGKIFCSKNCLIACFQNLDACNGGCRVFCSTCDPDGAFFDTATLDAHGRTIHTGGPLTCVEGATADIGVTITQGAGGAVATGRVHVKCPPQPTTFTVTVKTKGPASFPAFGTVKACGRASIHGAKRHLDSFQWCRDITLLPEGVQLQE